MQSVTVVGTTAWYPGIHHCNAHVGLGNSSHLYVLYSTVGQINLGMPLYYCIVVARSTGLLQRWYVSEMLRQLINNNNPTKTSARFRSWYSNNIQNVVST
jgi:hypothetical protein